MDEPARMLPYVDIMNREMVRVCEVTREFEATLRPLGFQPARVSQRCLKNCVTGVALFHAFTERRKSSGSSESRI